MTLSLGVDMVEVVRIEKAILKWGGYFLKRVFTTNEITYSKKQASPYQHLAARFAVKEAVLKALGSGFTRDVLWTDIEVKNEKSGRPRVKLSGSIKKIKARLRVQNIIISISHTYSHALAGVILVSKQ